MSIGCYQHKIDKEKDYDRFSSIFTLLEVKLKHSQQPHYSSEHKAIHI